MHKPVLVREVLHFLRPEKDSIIVDATLGGGGHAEEILKELQGTGWLLAMDQDAEAVARARGRFVVSSVKIEKASFMEMDEVFKRNGIEGVDGVLFDLGLSSDQLDEAGRGFSFRLEGPLDMRMDREMGTRAEDLVNDLGERDLADLFYRYGEERKARVIARRIVERRAGGRIQTTRGLAAIVEEISPRRGARIHPATRIFQALRIGVNRELECLERGLGQAIRALKPGGRVVVISYHSLEDRIVKRKFREATGDNVLKILTKKVVRPQEAEVEANPRARSAKLRAAEKTGHPGRPEERKPIA